MKVFLRYKHLSQKFKKEREMGEMNDVNEMKKKEGNGES
jgi:hypothetical protein